MADGSIKILTDLDTSGFEKGMSKLGSVAKTGLSVITTGIAAISAGLTAAAGYAVSVGSSFEAGMSEVAAISGATGEELQALTDKAKEMGASTKFSATESAEALKYMAMAGWDTDKMLSGLPGVMNLAAASGENLGVVSDIVTDSMTAFGLSADQAGHFADVLAQASSKSNTNVSLMGETFKYVAPVAGALGYSIEDTAVAIGLMANSGIKGSQAGTALRSTLSRLAKPTDEVQGAMDKLGISLTDSEGEMKSLGDVMQDMRKGFQGLTEDQKAQYAAALAGQEGMSGLLAIVNTSDEDFNALADAINNADGASQRMADTMQDNLQGAVTIAKSALEGLGITVYESFSGSMKDTVQTVTGYVNELNDAFSHGLDSGVKQIGTVFAKAVTDIARQAPKMVKAAVSLMKSFVNGLKSSSKQIASAAIEIGKALLDGIKDIIPEVISAAIEITAALADNLFGSQVGDAVHRLGDTLQGTFKTVMKTVDSVINIVGSLVGAFGGPLLDIINILAQAINGLLTGVNFVLSAIESFTTGLDTLFWGTQTATESLTTFTEAEMELKEQADSVAEAMASQHEKTLESMEATNTSMDHVSKLATELLGLADANGKVKDSDQARAQFILDTLNGALGTEYEMTDGVIQQYDQLTDAVYEVIEAKRVDALMNAYYDDYVLALQNVSDAEQRMIQGMEDYGAHRQTTQEIERQYREALEKWQTASEQGWIEENGVYKEYTRYMSEQDKERVDQLQARFEEERRLTVASKQDWEKYQAQYGEINDTINDYEKAYEEVLNHNYEEAQRILQGKTDVYEEHAENVGSTVNSIKQDLQDEESAASSASGNIKSSLDSATEGVGDKASLEINKAIDSMEEKTNGTTLTGPKMGAVQGAVAAASAAINAMQAYANSRSISVSTRAHASGGYWAKGGVTKYARGGVSPEIHKHAAGVFTKRTRLWDPVTGINEYGEAGHEALLPLKQSVYNEIAKGIVRQLTPAKLSGMMSMLKSAVQSRTESIAVQVVEKRELRAAEKALSSSPETDALRDEITDLREKLGHLVASVGRLLSGMDDKASALLAALMGLRVELDGAAVGRMVTPEVNERLNDLYDLEERGRF